MQSSTVSLEASAAKLLGTQRKNFISSFRRGLHDY
jgi:hypothetical protein